MQKRLHAAGRISVYYNYYIHMYIVELPRAGKLCTHADVDVCVWSAADATASMLLMISGRIHVMDCARKLSITIGRVSCVRLNAAERRSFATS